MLLALITVPGVKCGDTEWACTKDRTIGPSMMAALEHGPRPEGLDPMILLMTIISDL